MAAEPAVPSNASNSCPDPAAHEKPNHLSEQASTAALYVTQPGRTNTTSSKGRADPVLDSDGKLSSKGAAASLKYAKPQDLPSFPSSGNGLGAAGAAAMLAKDYKMKELWQSEPSSAGSRAALKAHKDGGKLDLWQPSASATGNSAATIAMRNKTLSPELDRGHTDTGRTNSLLAATKVHVSDQGRKRAGSTPVVQPPPAYPDSKNSVANALNAATVSHRASVRSPRPAVEPEAGHDHGANAAANYRSMGTNMGKDMFGGNPQHAEDPETAEKKRQAALRASTLSMAKGIYEHQNRTVLGANPPPKGDTRDEHAVGAAGAGTAHKRNVSSISHPDLKQEAMKYIHLQDAAHKLAQERLAKVDKDMEPGRYREYYGYDRSPQRKSRLSTRGRRRASSDYQRDAGDSDDEQQARRIRKQMNQLSTGVDTVNDKQRSDDRAKVLAAAEKRVHDQMQGMDKKVFQDTGKVSQSMMDDWESKAMEKAEKDRQSRQTHPGKMHIGGGKFMDQAEIDAIAQARLQPTLDELADTAQKKRERDEGLARERDLAETARMEERQRQQEQKEEFQRVKNEDKATADKQKTEFKRIRDADKAAARKEKDERKAAEKAEKEAKRKSREPGAEGTDEAGDKKGNRVSMLGRMASKLKKREKPAKESEPKKSSDATAESSNTAGATAAGVGAGAAGAGLAAADSTDSTAQQQATSDKGSATSLAGGEDEAQATTAPLEETSTRGEDTSHQTDALMPNKKPDLERHISAIPDSSSGGLSDGFNDSSDEERAPTEPNARERSASPVSPLVEDEPAANTTTTYGPTTTTTTTTTVPVFKPTTTTSTTTSTDSPKDGKDKGLRGLMSKFRHRTSRQEPTSAPGENNKVTAPLPLTADPTPESTDPPRASTEAAAPTPHRASHSTSASTSSFHRHADPLRRLSSASSSGADEDDLARGRGGHGGAMATKTSAGAGMARGSEDGHEQFEEARDHFDESTAPPPAFGSEGVKGAKGSPAGGTRFREEL